MSKIKFALTDAQKKVVFPTVAAIVLLTCFFWIASDCLMKLTRAERAVREMDRQSRALKKLQSLKKSEKNLLKAFPAAAAKNDVIREIASWARKEGLEVVTIDPKEATLGEANFTQLALTIGGKGGYLKMGRFLKAVENAPYFLLVSNLKLSGFDPARMRSVRGTTEIDEGFQVTISAFLLI